MPTHRVSRILRNADEAMSECLAQPNLLAVIFVLSVLNKSTIRDDYDGYSISASFQKTDDLEDYISTVRGLGFYVQT